MCGARSAGAAGLLLLLAVTAAGRPSHEVDLSQNLVQTGLVETSQKNHVETTSAAATPAASVDDEPVNLQYPHAVLYGRTCGGTIISPTWIITAAHCTIFTSGHTVLAGTNNTINGSGVLREVKRTIIHPLFSVGPYWVDAESFGIKQVGARWDFLLVELEEPLPLDGKTIAAATLDDDIKTPDNLDIGFAGFGTKNHGGTMRHFMHGMELTTVSDKSCQKKLPEFNPQDMICVKGRPPRYDTACNGDSGSGLVSQGKLYGVLSWVEDDAIRCWNGAVLVASRIAAVRDWIRQVTKI